LQLWQLARAFPDDAKYVPAEHETHVLWAVDTWYRPALHDVHSPAPALEYWPATQFWQPARALPDDAKYVPAKHAAHVLWAAETWYRPALHCVHVIAPAPEYTPAAQLRHAVAPEADAYAPAAQLEHADDPELAA